MRFYIALWSSKLLLFFLKILKKEKDDKPGLLAYRICKNFNEKINKPDLTIVVTGSASEIFGKKIKINELTINALGIFDYISIRDERKNFLFLGEY